MNEERNIGMRTKNPIRRSSTMTFKQDEKLKRDPQTLHLIREEQYRRCARCAKQMNIRWESVIRLQSTKYRERYFCDIECCFRWAYATSEKEHERKLAEQLRIDEELDWLSGKAGISRKRVETQQFVAACGQEIRKETGQRRIDRMKEKNQFKKMKNHSKEMKRCSKKMK